MAEIVFFHYSPGDSYLKTRDARIKFPLLLLYTIILHYVSTRGLLFISAIAIFLFISEKPSYRRLLPELKGVFFLGILIFTATFSVNKNIVSASFTVLRFIITVLFGICLIQTTLPEEIEKAVYWFLKPFPFIHASLVATRIRLTIMFIPDLIDTTQKIKEARLARCIQRERNPVKKIKSLIIPLLTMIIDQAEQTAYAMEARCYTDEKRYTLQPLEKKDIITAGAGLLGAGLSFFL